MIEDHNGLEAPPCFTNIPLLYNRHMNSIELYCCSLNPLWQTNHFHIAKASTNRHFNSTVPHIQIF